MSEGPTAQASAVLVLLILTMTACSLPPVAAPPPGASRIEIPLQPITAGTVSLEDLVDLREVHEPQLSPDGQTVAFLVRQAFRDCNCYRTALFVAEPGNPRPPRKLTEDSYLSNLRWSPRGNALTYLASGGGTLEVWKVAISSPTPAVLLRHRIPAGATWAHGVPGPRNTRATGIERYEWSPDGRSIAFVTTPASDSAEVRRMTDAGVVYDDERMWIFDIWREQWAREPAELWVYDLTDDTERQLWRAPVEGALPWSVGIASLAWSPEGHEIALSYASDRGPTGHGFPDIGVVDLATGNFRPVVTTRGVWEDGPVWSPDGTQVAFASNELFDAPGARSMLGVLTVSTGAVNYFARGNAGPSVSRIWWQDSGQDLVFESVRPGDSGSRMRGLYGVNLANGDVRRLTGPGDNVSDCGSAAAATLACVWQTSNRPPDPSIVNLVDGSVEAVARVNPEWLQRRRADVREIRWTNRYGSVANGFLLRPLQYDPGERYPLVLIPHRFEGRFVAAAEGISSYPAQILSREGFVVLLVNLPPLDPFEGNDFKRGTMDNGLGPLATLESAAALLVSEGLVDSSRVGIMGWSAGGTVANVAITSSSKFAVVSILSGGFADPGGYWITGTKMQRVIHEKYFGGPPFGKTLANWVAYSPSLNAGKVRVPVLMETSADEAVFNFEMFAALQRHDVPVEFVIYPDDGHTITQPVHRMSSMQRNLDWFVFWLMGRENADPAYHVQNQRWRTLRARFSGPASHATE